MYKFIMNLHSHFVMYSHLAFPKTFSPSPSPSDYYPISLLSVVNKIFECHVFNVLSNIISVDNIPCNNQFGFRAAFSTECALLAVTQSWLSTLESNKSICGIFFSSLKPLNLSLITLFFLCNLGLPAHPLCWFCSYLSDHSHQVSISSYPSSKAILFLLVLFLLMFHKVPSLAFYCLFYKLMSFLNFPFQLVQEDFDLICHHTLPLFQVTYNQHKENKYMIVTRKSQLFGVLLPSLYVKTMLLMNLLHLINT